MNKTDVFRELVAGADPFRIEAGLYGWRVLIPVTKARCGMGCSDSQVVSGHGFVDRVAVLVIPAKGADWDNGELFNGEKDR